MIYYFHLLAVASKTRQHRTFRPKTLLMNARFLRHLAAIDIGTKRLDPEKFEQTPDPQAFLDSFYVFVLGMLDEFYPERTITVTLRNPSYVTPKIKAKLRKKNRLMHTGRAEEAGALIRQIGRDITRRIKCQLEQINGKSDIRELWKAVRQLTGCENSPAADPSITADSLYRHYASMLTPDPSSHYRKSLLQNVEVGFTMFRSTGFSEYWTLSGQQPLDSTNCWPGSSDWQSPFSAIRLPT